MKPINKYVLRRDMYSTLTQSMAHTHRHTHTHTHTHIHQKMYRVMSVTERWCFSLKKMLCNLIKGLMMQVIRKTIKVTIILTLPVAELFSFLTWRATVWVCVYCCVLSCDVMCSVVLYGWCICILINPANECDNEILENRIQMLMDISINKQKQTSIKLI